MKASSKLTLIKTVHTLVWLFFNLVLFYLFYAVIVDKIDRWLWIGLGLIFCEGLVLLSFKNQCPLTVLARRYSASVKDNFDIFLPNWLAKYNKRIYTCFLAVIIALLIWRLAR